MCKNCHDNYDYQKTVSEYENLFNLKRKYEAAYDAKMLLSSYPVEESIEAILKKLSKLKIDDIDSMTKLSMEALRIRDKVKNLNSLLIRNIEEQVAQYFLFIQDFISVPLKWDELNN